LDYQIPTDASVTTATLPIHFSVILIEHCVTLANEEQKRTWRKFKSKENTQQNTCTDYYCCLRAII
jgi:hypothetical protein